MMSGRWEAITKVFEAALEKPQSDRETFVRNACAGDSELESEVARLLAADEDAGSFLERPAISAIPPQFAPNRESSLLASGSLISGRFEILRFIGQGGMGQVYEAFDRELKERVALKAIRKEISSDPRMLSRFRREALLTRRITHPNVCRTFDIYRYSSTADDGTNSDITFLTMELLEGETLADLLRRQRRLTATEALPLVLQMIEGLGAAHNVSIVHRDFKPPNVLLVPSSIPSSNGLRVVVTDFGLARAFSPQGQISAEQAATSLTGNLGFMGTPVYMAPEQFERGEATVATDIYTLGLVMYEMVTGARPFADDIPSAEAVKRVKQAAPSAKILAPDLDPAWEAAICRCLEGEPKDRFENVAQVAESIANVEREPSTSRDFGLGRSQGAEVRALSSPRTRPWRKWAVAIAIFVSVVSLSAVLFRHYQVRRDAKLAGGSTVLLTEIRNSTGDKRFDGTTELIRHQLSQSPYFNLMDAGRIRDVLTQMTKPADAPLDPPTSREVALRSGAPRVIFGVVSRVGDSYVLDIDIEQSDNNPRRARAQWDNHWTWNMSSGTSDKEIPNAFLSAVRDSSDWIRSEVGESANDIARVDAPPQDVTTDNWAALSEFAQAEKFKAAGQDNNAVVALENAVAADPYFALAYTRLGDVLVSLGRSDEGYRAYRVALAQEQQHRLTRREKYRLEGIYALDTEDFKTADSRFRDYTVYYPNDYLGWFYRATPLMMTGNVEGAIASLKTAEAIDPARLSAPAHIARFDLILGNFDDASKWIQHLRETKHPDDATMIEGQLEFLRGHYNEALTHFEKLRLPRDPRLSTEPPPYTTYSFSLQARVFAELGQYQNAVEALDKGMEADLAAGDVVHRADKLLDRAYINSKRGQYEACLQDSKEALQLDRSLQRSLAAGTILGRAASENSGRLKSELTSELRKIEMRLPRVDFKPISDVVRARLRGELLLTEGKWQSALDEFRKADRLDALAKDKEYLARGLLAAALHTSNQAASAGLKKSALGAYANLALKPGQAWELPQEYFPGQWSDEAFAYASLASEIKEFKEQAESVLKQYVARRESADAGLPDVVKARKLLEEVQIKIIH
jgi:serine/threonine protein kinase/tetratricopeptide (TPR) repeat protein